jgi:hypothetical protein
MTSYGVGDRRYNNKGDIYSLLEPLREDSYNNLKEGFADDAEANIKAISDLMDKDSKKNTADYRQFASTIIDTQNGYYTLKEQAQQLINNQKANYETPKGPATVKGESQNLQQLKMQRQKDNEQVVDNNSNLLILGLITLSSVSIFGTLLYLQ